MTAVWISAPARARLEAELRELVSHREPPTEDGGDAVVEAWLERKNRIREIHELLSNAIDELPPDDGVAEPGMVLTVRYQGSEDQETFLLGVRGAEHVDLEVYSPTSPLGQALLGAVPGETRQYRLPNGSQQAVTLLAATPMHSALTLNQ